MAMSRGSKAVIFAAVAALCYAACYHSATAPTTFVGGAGHAGQKREVDVARRGIDIKLKRRIKSVGQTMKTTDAMRVVAAAKVRRAQADSENTRPFSDELQGMIKGLVKKLKGSGLEAELPMLKVSTEIKSIALVVIGSDRGLCGAYNSFIFNRVLTRVTDLNAAGIKPKLVTVGKKCKQYSKSKLIGLDFEQGTEFMYGKGGAKLANEVGDEVKNLFLSGEVDKVEIIYAKFVTLLKNVPIVRTLLPLTPQGIEDPEDETFRLTSQDGQLTAEKAKVPKTKAKNIESDVIFDQSPETILNSMLPLYLNSILLSALFDAQASELSSRMTAMKAATDNAKEVKAKLTTVYNRKRQAAITAELCDIIGGCVGLESKDDGLEVGAWDNERTVTDEFMKEIDEGSTQNPVNEGIMDMVSIPIAREETPFEPIVLPENDLEPSREEFFAEN